MTSLLMALLLCSTGGPVTPGAQKARNALVKLAPRAKWSKRPRLVGDVNGDGKADFVFSASNRKRYLVGIVLGGKASPVKPTILKFDASEEAAGPSSNATLSFEVPSFDPDELGWCEDVEEDCAELRKLGAAVAKAAKSGLKGVRLEDEGSDAFHIFWNPLVREFGYWRL